MSVERLGTALAITAAIAAGTETSSAAGNDRVQNSNQMIMEQDVSALSSGISNPDKQLLMSQFGATESATTSAPTSTTTFTFKTETSIASTTDSDLAKDKINVLVNVKPKPMPKSWVRKQKAAGNCHMVGKGTAEPVVYTQGYNVNNMSEYGRDTRRSLVCNGIRVACRNKVKETPPVNIIPNVKFVKTWNEKADVKVSSDAIAYCAAGSTWAYAKATGKATGKVSVKGMVRTNGNNAASIVEKANLEARTSAVAKVFCSSSSIVILIEGKPPEIVQCTDVHTAEECAPKDGHTGTGAGTPGNTSTGSTVGGVDTPNPAGNETAAVQCYDPANTTGGDQIATTSGRIMYVKLESEKDQLGYCLIKAEEPVNP